MAINFGLLNTQAPAEIGNAIGNALAVRRQRDLQDEQLAQQRQQFQVQNALAGMQLQKAQADAAEEAAYKNALAGVQGGDWKTAMPQLMQASPARAMALQKQVTEMERGKVDTQAKLSDIAHKTLGMYREQLTNVNTPEQFAQWLTAQHNDPALAPIMSSLPSLEDSLRTIPQDPRQFQEMKLKSALGLAKYLEMNKPISRTLNLGGQERVQMVNPNTGEIVSEQSYGKTASPDALMTDARSRAQMAQSERQFQAQQGLAQEKLGFERQKLGAEGMKLTEIQGKSQLFGSRAAEADKILNGLEGSVSPTALAVKRGLENTWGIGGALGAVANSVMSENAQRAEQAQRDFVNAVLRLESGAAISPSEFASAQKQYFAQPGDSPAVIEQKQRNRQTAIAGLRTMAGPASVKVQPRSDEPAQPSAPGRQEFNSMPNPAQYAGKVVTDTETGLRYRSNGKQWMKE